MVHSIEPDTCREEDRAENYISHLYLPYRYEAFMVWKMIPFKTLMRHPLVRRG
jgi:hypothetical protein